MAKIRIACVEVMVNGERMVHRHANANAHAHSYVGMDTAHEIRVTKISNSEEERTHNERNAIAYPIQNVVRYWHEERDGDNPTPTPEDRGRVTRIERFIDLVKQFAEIGEAISEQWGEGDVVDFALKTNNWYPFHKSFDDIVPAIHDWYAALRRTTI